MAHVSFVAKTNFVPAHPHSLAIYCSDGRFTQAVEEFLAHLGHATLDTLTFPGGPALLSPATSYSERESMVRASSFLIAGHEIRHVVLIAHAGCGYYRDRYAGMAPEAIEAKQLADLSAAREALLLTHPTLDVRTQYLRVAGAKVQFEEP